MHKMHTAPSQWTPWPMTFQPWQRVHVDFCGPFLDKYQALVITDTYSKWPEVFITQTANSTFVITALRKCFSREVVPQVLVSDNGTPFRSRETMTWLHSVGCRQVFSPPRHPVSNGAAENAVKSLKSAIYSARPNNLAELERTVDNYLLQYRNATHCTTKTSPAMLFKGRHLRAQLKCMDTSDVLYFQGNDYRLSKGIVTRQIGQRMVEVTDLADGSVHRRHVDQVRFRRLSASREDSVDLQGGPQTNKEQTIDQMVSKVPLTATDATNDPTSETTTVQHQETAWDSLPRRSNCDHHPPDYLCIQHW